MWPVLRWKLGKAVSGNGLVELQITFSLPSPGAIKLNELETCTKIQLNCWRGCRRRLMTEFWAKGDGKTSKCQTRARLKRSDVMLSAHKEQGKTKISPNFPFPLATFFPAFVFVNNWQPKFWLGMSLQHVLRICSVFESIRYSLKRLEGEMEKGPWQRRPSILSLSPYLPPKKPTVCLGLCFD